MPIQIRVLTWNIAEGNDTRNAPSRHAPIRNVCIPGIIDRIREFCPDILLLNEVLNYNGGGMQQAQEIARGLFMPDVFDTNHTPIGFESRKSVSIVSRYPLTNQINHPVRFNGMDTTFFILEARTTILGRRHHLYSVRFNAHEEPPRSAGIAQMAAMAATTRSTEAVIVGGDFNTGHTTPEMLDFARNSLTSNANNNATTNEWVSVDGADMVDNIYYRGPYTSGPYTNRYFRSAKDWAGLNLSDHPYVLADLVEEGNGLEVALGARLKLKHWATGAALHSHAINYGHEHGSSQQQVTGFASRDDNDYWVIENVSSSGSTGTLIGNGAEIRLRHEATGKWLQGDPKFFSPASSNFEIAAGSQVGDNCVWIIELEKCAGNLSLGDCLRLRHKNMGVYLYATPGANGGSNTANQQEICGVSSRDSNTRWALFEFHNPSPTILVPGGWIEAILNLLKKWFKSQQQ